MLVVWVAKISLTPGWKKSGCVMVGDDMQYLHKRWGFLGFDWGLGLEKKLGLGLGKWRLSATKSRIMPLSGGTCHQMWISLPLFLCATGPVHVPPAYRDDPSPEVVDLVY
jgi:hypothetical protein